MNESALRDKVRGYLKDKGWFKKIPCGIYMQGVPDFVGCVKGHFIAIELKRDRKGRLTKLQELTIKEIKEKGGGLSFVAYGWDDFVRKFEYIYKEVLKNGTKQISTEEVE